MFRYLLLASSSLVLLLTNANAQTTTPPGGVLTTFSPGSPIYSAAVNAAFASAVNVTNGASTNQTLTTPTLIGPVNVTGKLITVLPLTDPATTNQLWADSYGLIHISGYGTPGIYPGSGGGSGNGLTIGTTSGTARDAALAIAAETAAQNTATAAGTTASSAASSASSAITTATNASNAVTAETTRATNAESLLVSKTSTVAGLQLGNTPTASQLATAIGAITSTVGDTSHLILGNGTTAGLGNIALTSGSLVAPTTVVSGAGPVTITGSAAAPTVNLSFTGISAPTTLAKVAASGNYSDLANLPSLLSIGTTSGTARDAALAIAAENAASSAATTASTAVTTETSRAINAEALLLPKTSTIAGLTVGSAPTASQLVTALNVPTITTGDTTHVLLAGGTSVGLGNITVSGGNLVAPTGLSALTSLASPLVIGGTLSSPTINLTFTAGTTTPTALSKVAATNNYSDLTGLPTLGTAAAQNSTAFDAAGVAAGLVASLAPLANPSFTGVPVAPTATAGTNTTQIATTAFTTNAVSTETTRAVAAETASAQRTNNLSDLSNAATARTNLGLGSAALSASTAFDAAGAATAAVTGLASLSSPTFTGTPSATTATAGTNTTQIATTAFTTTAVGNETTRATVAEALATQKVNNLSDLANVATARTNLGLGTAALSASTAFDAAGAAATVQAGDLQKANNLSDLANVATARTNLGLGTAALSASTAFDAAGAATSAVTGLATLASPAFTGTPTSVTATAGNNTTQIATTAFTTTAVGTETTRATAAEALAAQKANNLSDLASAATARTNLGLGTAALSASTAFDAAGAATTAQAASLQKSSNLSDLASAATARTNLGLGSAATANTTAFDASGVAASYAAALAPINSPTFTGTPVVPGYVPVVAGDTSHLILGNGTTVGLGNLTVTAGAIVAPSGGGNVSTDSYGSISSQTAHATNGVSNRTLAQRASDMLNVKDFGATGNGSTATISSVYGSVTLASLEATSVNGATPFAALSNPLNGLTFSMTSSAAQSGTNGQLTFLSSNTGGVLGWAGKFSQFGDDPATRNYLIQPQMQVTASCISGTGTIGNTVTGLPHLWSIPAIPYRAVDLLPPPLTTTTWAASRAYALGTVRVNGGNAYVVTTAGTSASSGGPTGTGSSITDGSVTWKYVASGNGFTFTGSLSGNTLTVTTAGSSNLAPGSPITGSGVQAGTYITAYGTGTGGTGTYTVNVTYTNVVSSETMTASSLTAETDWLPSTPYPAGAIVAANGGTWMATTAGTSGTGNVITTAMDPKLTSSFTYGGPVYPGSFYNGPVYATGTYGQPWQSSYVGTSSTDNGVTWTLLNRKGYDLSNFGTFTLAGATASACGSGTVFTFTIAPAALQALTLDWLGIQTALAQSLNATQGYVWLPAGQYEINHTLVNPAQTSNTGAAVPSNQVRGSGIGSTVINVLADLGQGAFALTDAQAAGTTLPWHSETQYTDFSLDGPSGNSANSQYAGSLGGFPNEMDGLGLGQEAQLSLLQVQNFHAGVVLTGDHQRLWRGNLTNNACNIEWGPYGGSMGNQHLDSMGLTGSTISSMCVAPTNQIDSSVFWDVHTGFGPLGLYGMLSPPNVTTPNQGFLTNSTLTDVWMESTGEEFLRAVNNAAYLVPISANQINANHIIGGGSQGSVGNPTYSLPSGLGDLLYASNGSAAGLLHPHSVYYGINIQANTFMGTKSDGYVYQSNNAYGVTDALYAAIAQFTDNIFLQDNGVVDGNSTAPDVPSAAIPAIKSSEGGTGSGQYNRFVNADYEGVFHRANGGYGNWYAGELLGNPSNGGDFFGPYADGQNFEGGTMHSCATDNISWCAVIQRGKFAPTVNGTITNAGPVYATNAGGTVGIAQSISGLDHTAAIGTAQNGCSIGAASTNCVIYLNPGAGGGAFGAVSTTVASGTAQGSNPITSRVMRYTSVVSGGAVTLATVPVGSSVTIYNDGANALSVFPQTGGAISSLATNAATSVPAGGSILLTALSSTAWH